MVWLSALDQSPISEGGTASEALHTTVWLAERLDKLGFTRYWVAEHHNSPGFAGSAPEILVTVLLGVTRRMRIGSGGVLLPRYEATKIAEVFSVLAGLYPGRVDLGIGRAGGDASRFRDQVLELHNALGIAVPGESNLQSGSSVPSVSAPRIWLLGGSVWSARQAAALGTRFCSAHFLKPDHSQEALAAYHRDIRSETPHGAIAVRVLVADTDAKANQLANAYLLWRSRKDLEDDRPFPSDETVLRHRWTGAQLERAAINRRALISGVPDQVRDRVLELTASHAAEEIVVNTLAYDPADRLRSYQLLAEVLAISSGASPVVGTVAVP